MKTQCFSYSMSTKCAFDDILSHFKTMWKNNEQLIYMNFYIYAPFDLILSLDLIHDQHEQTPLNPDILILTDNNIYPSSSFDEACVSRVNTRGRWPNPVMLLKSTIRSNATTQRFMTWSWVHYLFTTLLVYSFLTY